MRKMLPPRLTARPFLTPQLQPWPHTDPADGSMWPGWGRSRACQVCKGQRWVGGFRAQTGGGAGVRPKDRGSATPDNLWALTHPAIFIFTMAADVIS